MAGVEAKSGIISYLELTMSAFESYSENRLIMDYQDLVLNVLKADEGGKFKKRGLVSSVANTVIRRNNLPHGKNYVMAEYRTERNIYKGPFNFIWVATRQGIEAIVPSKSAKVLMGGGKKEGKE